MEGNAFKITGNDSVSKNDIVKINRDEELERMNPDDQKKANKIPVLFALQCSRPLDAVQKYEQSQLEYKNSKWNNFGGEFEGFLQEELKEVREKKDVIDMAGGYSSILEHLYRIMNKRTQECEEAHLECDRDAKLEAHFWRRMHRKFLIEILDSIKSAVDYDLKERNNDDYLVLVQNVFLDSQADVFDDKSNAVGGGAKVKMVNMVSEYFRKFNPDKNIDERIDVEKVIETLIDRFVEYDEPYESVYRIDDILGKKATFSAKILLDKLNHAKNQKSRENIGKLLYRLEFGQIGISEEGVKYLGKIYDLQEFNNPEYFVNRLTAKGDIGVFDENSGLQKYFNIGDLSSGETTVKPRVLDFAYETLFTPKADETPKEREEREKYLQEFKENYFGFYNEDFYQKTGVRFNNLDFKEQGWFMLCHKHADPEKQEKLMQFITTHGENSLKTFLSLEHGGQGMGKKILKIGEKFDQATADAIFAKYVELVDYAQKSGEYLAEQFNMNDKDKAQKITEHLLGRGKALLCLCADEELSLEKIYAKLDGIKGEMEIFTATLESAKNDGVKVDFEIVRDLKIEEKAIGEGNSLTQQEKESLTRIFSDNYRDIFAKNPAAYERVLNDFVAEIGDLEGQMVYLMKYKNEIVAFCRFAPVSENEVYGGSLNVSKDVQGLAVGDYFIKSTLEKVSSQYDIKIKTRKDNPANNNYQKRGFLIVGMHKADDGVEYLDMILPSKNQLRKAA